MCGRSLHAGEFLYARTGKIDSWYSHRSQYFLQNINECCCCKFLQIHDLMHWMMRFRSFFNIGRDKSWCHSFESAVGSSSHKFIWVYLKAEKSGGPAGGRKFPFLSWSVLFSHKPSECVTCSSSDDMQLQGHQNGRKEPYLQNWFGKPPNYNERIPLMHCTTGGDCHKKHQYPQTFIANFILYHILLNFTTTYLSPIILWYGLFALWLI